MPWAGGKSEGSLQKAEADVSTVSEPQKQCCSQNGGRELNSVLPNYWESLS